MADLLRDKNPGAFDKAVRASKSIMGEIDHADSFVCLVYEAGTRQVIVASNVPSQGNMIEFIEKWLAIAKREYTGAAS